MFWVTSWKQKKISVFFLLIYRVLFANITITAFFRFLLFYSFKKRGGGSACMCVYNMPDKLNLGAHWSVNEWNVPWLQWVYAWAHCSPKLERTDMKFNFGWHICWLFNRFNSPVYCIINKRSLSICRFSFESECMVAMCACVYLHVLCT